MNVSVGYLPIAAVPSILSLSGFATNGGGFPGHGRFIHGSLFIAHRFSFIVHRASRRQPSTATYHTQLVLPSYAWRKSACMA